MQFIHFFIIFKKCLTTKFFFNIKYIENIFQAVDKKVNSLFFYEKKYYNEIGEKNDSYFNQKSHCKISLFSCKYEIIKMVRIGVEANGNDQTNT